MNLADHGIPTILDFLVTADEFILDDLVDHLQTYLIEQRYDDLERTLLACTKSFLNMVPSKNFIIFV